MQKIFNSSIFENLNFHTLAPKINFLSIRKNQAHIFYQQNNDIMPMTYNIYEIQHQTAGSKWKTFFKSPLDTQIRRQMSQVIWYSRQHITNWLSTSRQEEKKTQLYLSFFKVINAIDIFKLCNLWILAKYSFPVNATSGILGEALWSTMLLRTFIFPNTTPP